MRIPKVVAVAMIAELRKDLPACKTSATLA